MGTGGEGKHAHSASGALGGIALKEPRYALADIATADDEYTRPAKARRQCAEGALV